MTSEGHPPRKRWAARGLRVASWVLVLGLVAVAASVLYERREAVGDAGGLPGVVPSAAAVLIYFTANALLAWNWSAIVAVAGPKLPFRTALWVWSISQVSRYTVTLAQVGSRAVVARRYGVPATAGVLSTVLELAWMFMVTSTIVVATVPWWLPIAGDARWVVWVAALPVVGIVAAVAHPRAMLRAVDAVVRRPLIDRLTRGRLAGVAARAPIDRATMWRFVARYGANTALRHAAFLTMFAAVGGDLRTHALTAAGTYALGSLAGTVAVFAPGGLGVREGLIAVALAPVIGGGSALLLAAAVRLLEVVAELSLLGVARLLRGDVTAVVDSSSAG